VVQFKNITVNSDHTSGTVSFVVVSKSAVTNDNDGLNCPVSASPFNSNCPCGNCTQCYTAPPTTAVATQLEFAINANGCDTNVSCSTQPVVAIQDYLANTLTTSTVTVTLSVKSGLRYLLGTTSVAAVDGIATFSDLRFSATGSYVITASITHGSATIAVDSGCISVYGPGMIVETATPTGAPTQRPTVAGSYVLVASMTLTGMTSAEFLQPSIVAEFKSTLVRSFESTSLTITTEDLTITSPTRRSGSVDVTTEVNTGTTDSDAASSAGSAMDSYVSGGSFASDLSSATGVSLAVSGYSSAVTQPSSATAE